LLRLQLVRKQMKCQYQFRKDLKGYILFFLIDIDE